MADSLSISSGKLTDSSGNTYKMVDAKGNDVTPTFEIVKEDREPEKVYDPGAPLLVAPPLAAQVVNRPLPGEAMPDQTLEEEKRSGSTAFDPFAGEADNPSDPGPPQGTPETQPLDAAPVSDDDVPETADVAPKDTSSDDDDLDGQLRDDLYDLAVAEEVEGVTTHSTKAELVEGIRAQRRR